MYPHTERLGALSRTVTVTPGSRRTLNAQAAIRDGYMCTAGQALIVSGWRPKRPHRAARHT
eukprot:15480644-Alexandrium_andersonii.AAC.2